ncbi:MAG TPA: hypothetical protein VHT91_14420 [Kofleriaceae bacterium]|jgi:hypothetical protein|nr:hypothetical protein [Kofleriaceae bacterium]
MSTGSSSAAPAIATDLVPAAALELNQEHGDLDRAGAASSTPTCAGSHTPHWPDDASDPLRHAWQACKAACEDAAQQAKVAA